MALFKNLFGKSESRTARILARKALHEAQQESKPYAALDFAILESANRCLERMRPFFLSTKTDTELLLTEYSVFQ
jgi:hypothetical protein